MASNRLDLTIVLGLIDKASPKLKLFESSVIRTVGAISAAFVTFKAVVFPISSAAKFERAMKDVQKTTGFTSKQIKAMSANLVEMSVNLGIAATDLAIISATAGQLGLGDAGQESIEKFTESVARATVTLDLTAQAAAETGAQLQSIFNLDPGAIEKTFSLLNELSNNSVASATDLADIMKRIGTVVGTTNVEAAALAATFRELGTPNEQAGTAGVKFLGNLLSESQKFADAVGKTQQDWVKTVAAGSLEALKEVLNVLSDMEAAEAAALTKELFGSGRLFSAANKLIGDAANGFKNLDKFLGLATDGFREGTSSIDEYDNVMNSVIKQTDRMARSFEALGLIAGEQALGTLQVNVEKLTEALADPTVIEFFVDLGKGMADFIGDISDGIRAVAAWNIPWRNVIKTLEILLGLKIIAWLGRLALALAQTTVSMVLFATTGRTLSTVLAGAGGAAGIVGSIAAVNALLRQFALFLTGAAIGMVQVAAASTGVARAIALVRAAMLGLGAGIAGVVGVLGPVVLIIGAIVFTWWDDIKKFLGFVDEEELKRKNEAKRLRKDLAKERAEIQAKFEESVTNAEKESESGVLLDTEARLTLDAEQYISEVNRARDRYVAYIAVVKNGRKELSNTEGLLETTKNNIASLTTEVDKAAEKWQKYADRLAIVQRSGEKSSLTKALQTGLDESKKQLDDLTKRRTELQERADQLVSIYDKTSATVANASKEASAIAAKSVADRFDELTVQIIKETSRRRQIEDAINEASREQKKINDSLAKPQEDADQERLTNELVKVTATIKVLKQQAEDTKKSTDALKKSITSVQQVELIKGAESLDSTKIQLLDEGLKDIEVSAKSAEQAMLELNGVEIIEQNILLTKEKGLLEAVARGYSSMAKSAQSAFDNVNIEVRSAQRRTERFIISFKEGFAQIKAAIQGGIALDKLDAEYDKSTDKIESYYDNIIKKAEEAGQESLASTFKSLKKDALERAKLANDNERAELEATILRKQYNAALEISTKLAAEAQVATDNGDLIQAESLLKESADSIEDAKSSMKELQQLYTTTNLGKIELLIDKEGIAQQLIDGVLAAQKFLGATTVGVKEGVRDQAAEQDLAAQKALALFNDRYSANNEQLAKVLKIDGAKAIYDAILRASKDGGTEFAKQIAEVTKNLSAQAGAATPSGFNNTADIRALLDDTESVTSEFSTVWEDNIQKYREAIQLGTTEQKEVFDAARAAGASIQEATVQAVGDIAEALENSRRRFEEPFTVGVKANITELNADDAPVVVIKAELDVVNPGVTTSGSQGFAKGGMVTGRGGIDKINAWLTKDEFVVDAMTTKAMGAPFFYGLMDMVHKGRRRVQSMKQGLPAFAAGGLASAGVGAGLPLDEVTLNLTIGNQQFPVRSSREQVSDLAKAIKQTRRGF